MFARACVYRERDEGRKRERVEMLRETVSMESLFLF